MIRVNETRVFPVVDSARSVILPDPYEGGTSHVVWVIYDYRRAYPGKGLSRAEFELAIMSAGDIDQGLAPAWADEVYSWFAVASQLVITGHIADLHLGRRIGESGRTLHSTVDIITDRLRASGYAGVLGWDPVNGPAWIHVYPTTEPDSILDANLLAGQLNDQETLTFVEQLVGLLLAVTENEDTRVALIVNGAPRLAPSQSDAELHRVYVTAWHQANSAQPRRLPGDARPGLHNVVIWIVEREAELPHWLVGATGVRVVSVPEPSRADREEQCAATLEHLDGYEGLPEPERAELVGRFAGFTEGLSLAAIAAAGQVAVDRAIPATRVEEAVRFVRSANARSPWNTPRVRASIADAAKELGDTVLGQARAVRKVADVLARAAIGLSGAYSSSHPTRPQGVLFFAGPTGVGKTEVAKKIAEMVFGRAEAMIRFDMSEFSAENSEARLLGAPPGYVGHQAGGELTNAVRRRPFCLLLFDEIEKAHPRILDKFLQILDDGRLTDSAGGTVHFTDTLIVFTSNLGTSPAGDESRRPIGRSRGRSSNMRPRPGYRHIDERVRAAIREEFRRLGRPELLNRIGDNIVVFDFITAPVAQEILRRHLDKVKERVVEQTRIRVSFSDEVMRDLDTIVTHADRLVFGGRAVGSVVESRILNPLARWLLTEEEPAHLHIVRIKENDEGAELQIDRTPLSPASR